MDTLSLFVLFCFIFIFYFYFSHMLSLFLPLRRVAYSLYCFSFLFSCPLVPRPQSHSCTPLPVFECCPGWLAAHYWREVWTVQGQLFLISIALRFPPLSLSLAPLHWSAQGFTLEKLYIPSLFNITTQCLTKVFRLFTNFLFLRNYKYGNTFFHFLKALNWITGFVRKYSYMFLILS